MIETKTVDTSHDPSPAQLIRYQINNHLGSATTELDENAQVISYEEYYPYGSTAYQAKDANIKAAAKRYRYTGKERDDETGLYYYGARYYAAWLGRWVSCDPIGVLSNINLFAFARSNPIRFIDKNGTYDDDIQYLIGLMERREKEKSEGIKQLQEFRRRIKKSSSHPSAWYLEKHGQLHSGNVVIYDRLKELSSTLSWTGNTLNYLGSIPKCAPGPFKNIPEEIDLRWHPSENTTLRKKAFKAGVEGRSTTFKTISSEKVTLSNKLEIEVKPTVQEKAIESAQVKEISHANKLGRIHGTSMRIGSTGLFILSFASTLLEGIKYTINEEKYGFHQIGSDIIVVDPQKYFSKLPEGTPVYIKHDSLPSLSQKIFGEFYPRGLYYVGKNGKLEKRI